MALRLSGVVSEKKNKKIHNFIRRQPRDISSFVLFVLTLGIC